VLPRPGRVLALCSGRTAYAPVANFTRCCGDRGSTFAQLLPAPLAEGRRSRPLCGHAELQGVPDAAIAWGSRERAAAGDLFPADPPRRQCPLFAGRNRVTGSILTAMATLAPATPCVLCGAAAVIEFADRGADAPTAPLCDHCAGLARNRLVTLGWCEAGHHYGHPLHLCRRHRIQFVSLGIPTPTDSRRHHRPI